MLAVGTRVAGYRIDGVLGHGGMGVVYEATQLSVNRAVALKILAPHLVQDPSFRRRFQREAEIQAGIDHSHIVTVFEAGEIDEGLFIAMRLVRGANLKDLIQSGELDVPRCLGILGQVADALDAAHAAGLIHRDVKPQNILVGAGDVTYLADFGLTKGPDHSALTRSGHVVGTLDYIAPEQIRGEQAVAASDVYALGGVLYECLTGAVPFPKSSDAAVMFAHVHEPPPRVSSQRPGLPEGLDDVIGRAMAKSPGDRFETSSGLIASAAAACAALVSPPLLSGRGDERPVASRADASVQGTLADPDSTQLASPAADANGHPTVVDTLVAPQGVRMASAPSSARPSRRATLAILASLAVLGVVAGLIAGAGGSSAARPDDSAGVAENRDLSVKYPSAWAGKAGDAASIGAGARDPISVGPQGASGQGLVAGIMRNVGVDLMPSDLRARLVGKLPRRERIRVGGFAAYRFGRLRLRGFPGELSLVVVPTTAGVAALACYGRALAGPLDAACQKVTGSVRLLRGKIGPLGPDPRLVRAVSGAVGGLARARDDGRRRMRDAKTAKRFSTAASSVATRYRRLAAGIRKTEVSPEALVARGAIAAALSDTATSYDALAASAAAGRRKGYSADARAVERAERQLRQTISHLESAGYAVGS